MIIHLPTGLEFTTQKDAKSYLAITDIGDW